MRFGCVNVRGWGVGKLEDMSTEMYEWGMDVVALTETHLRERVNECSEQYQMIGKGRSKWLKQGGGIGVMIRKEIGLEVDEMDIGNSEMSEDILALKIKHKSCGIKESLVVVVCYMTTAGEDAARDNERKYAIVKKVVRENRNEKVMIMGDMNGHIGILGEEVNENGQKLIDFTEEMHLENLNVTIGVGRETWSARGQKSAIDYMLVNERARKQVTSMWVDEERQIDISSDHNMLVMNYSRSTLQKNTVTKRPDRKRKWRLRDAKWDDFQVELTNAVWQGVQGVDETNEAIAATLRKVGARTIGYVKPRRQTGPVNGWFDMKIKIGMLERKRRNREQKKVKRLVERGEATVDEATVAWKEYEQQKFIVKGMMSEARAKDEKRIVEDLQNKGEEGGRDWFRFLRGDACNRETEIDEVEVQGVNVKDTNEMKNAIVEFWEDIGGMNEGVNGIYEMPQMYIERKDMGEMNEEMSHDEIESFLKKLKNGKAAGPDGIPYEMFKNGGRCMIEKLHDIFRKIWNEERVPKKWNECKVILLHKGGHKSKKELKNYRPIALADTVGKIFCGILNERVKEMVERHGVMGEEQNGFRRDRRGEDNMFVVIEMIERMKKDGKKGYMAFLDIEKAYDRVNRNILCDVLSKIGMSEKLVNIIRSMYDNTRAVYKIGELETGWVRSKRGVRQGCILSPILFGLYTEELAVRIKRTGLGIRVGNERLSCLLYADDIVIMSESKDELQSMLDAVSGYGRDFQVRFSGEKSQVIVVNGEERDVESKWRLGEVEIGCTTEYKYLGCWMTENGCDKAKSERMFRAQQWWGRLGSVARFRANRYECLRGLWKSVAVPGIMYGMDVMRWTESELSKLDVTQNKVGRMALGANRWVGVEAIRGEMGWSLFGERVMKAVLAYKVRLDRMSYARWAKKVHLWNSRKSKWEKDCKRRARKCGYQCIRPQDVEAHGDVWRMVNERGEGPDWSVKKWKKKIDTRVKQIGLEKWRTGMSGKSTLKWYEKKVKPMNERWYDGSRGGQLLFKARTQSLEVNARTYRWAENGTRVCMQCEAEVDETVEHMVLECLRYAEERAEMMDVVNEAIEPDVWNELREGEDHGMSFLLGLGNGKKRDVTMATKGFLEKAWNKRVRNGGLAIQPAIPAEVP